MDDGCRAFEREDATAGPAERAASRDHARICASCRDQEVADRALRELLAGAPCPSLPPFFAERCASRVRTAPPAVPLTARRQFVLRAYWLLTAIVTAGVVMRLAWSLGTGRRGGPLLFDSIAATPVALVAGVVVTFVTVVMPVLWLAHLRGGLPALMRRMLGATSA